MACIILHLQGENGITNMAVEADVLRAKTVYELANGDDVIARLPGENLVGFTHYPNFTFAEALDRATRLNTTVGRARQQHKIRVAPEGRN